MNLDKRYLILTAAIRIAKEHPSASRRWVMFHARTWAEMELRRRREP